MIAATFQSTSQATPAEKEANLRSLLQSYGSVVIAYSGGVDSTYLAAVAHEALSAHAYILTAQSPSMAEAEFTFASTLAKDRGWNFHVVQTAEADDPRWLRNDADRCYFCKAELFTVLSAFARERGISRILYGAIPEDFGDVRPGQRAAQEFEVAAPLVEVGLTKNEIRSLSQARNLPSWDKPQAACLASRFPTGTAITHEGLRQIDRAEAALLALGFRGHRVRYHGDLARIELQNGDWGRIGGESFRSRLVDAVKSAGFKYVTIDLAGYRPAGQNQ